LTLLAPGRSIEEVLVIDAAAAYPKARLGLSAPRRWPLARSEFDGERYLEWKCEMRVAKFPRLSLLAVASFGLAAFPGPPLGHSAPTQPGAPSNFVYVGASLTLAAATGRDPVPRLGEGHG